MGKDTTKHCADFLIGLWQAGKRCDVLPPDFLPADKHAAYRVQAHMDAQSSVPLYGWKIAATSVAGQKHIGVSGPLIGRYIAERVVPSGASIDFGTNHMRVAEIEFAFNMGNDLAPRRTPYTEEEVFEAVATLHPAIEIPDSRYNNFAIVGEAALIADNACAHWLCVGEAFPATWRNMDLAALEPVGRINGKNDVLGKGANVLGSPRLAMVWIANELSALGLGLRKGQIVSTGTCVIPMPIEPGDHVHGHFPQLGSIDVKLI